MTQTSRIAFRVASTPHVILSAQNLPIELLRPTINNWKVKLEVNSRMPPNGTGKGQSAYVIDNCIDHHIIQNEYGALYRIVGTGGSIVAVSAPALSHTLEWITADVRHLSVIRLSFTSMMRHLTNMTTMPN